MLQRVPKGKPLEQKLAKTAKADTERRAKLNKLLFINVQRVYTSYLSALMCAYGKDVFQTTTTN